LLPLAVTPASGETPAKNLLYNGSFELGMLQDWWGIMFPNARFMPEHITDKEAVHGKKSLTFRGDHRVFSRYLTFRQPGEYSFRFHVKASAPASVVVRFRAPPPPSPDNSAPERILVSRRFPVTTEWQRHRMSAHLPQGNFALLISLSAETRSVRYWLDAFELRAASVAEAAVDLGKDEEPGELEEDDDEEIFEEDEKARRFVPAHPVEAGLVSHVPGHIFYHSEKTDAALNVFNYGANDADTAIEFEIRNLEDKMVRKGKSDPVEAPAAKLVSYPFRIPTDTNGQFSLQYRATGWGGQMCEFVYSVIEKPTKHTVLGAHTYADKYHLSVLQRAGVRWYVSLTDGFLRSGNVHPEPGKYVWDDARPPRLERHGLKAIGVLEHGRFAEWGPRVSVKLEKPILQRGGYFESRRYVREDIWKEHVRTILSHYQATFRRWIIDDEINAGWDPRSYLRILRTTRDLAREIMPDVKVTTSADVHFFEELIDIAGPDSFDAICGSIGNASLPEKRKTRFLSEKYDKPVWVNALFGYSRTSYRTHRGSGSLDRLDRAISMCRHVIRNVFISRATYISPYILRLTKHSTTRPMPKSMLDYDGGLTPHGFGFIHGGTLLASVVEENLGELKLDSRAPIEAYAFRGHGRAGVFLLRSGAVVRLKWVEGMEARDWLGRPLELVVTDGQAALKMPGRAPAILTVAAGRGDELFNAVKGLELTVPTPPSGLRANEKFACRYGELVIEKHLVNESEKAVTFAVSAEKSMTLDPGGSTVLATPVTWNPARPLDNHRTPNRQRLWLHNCMKRAGPITIDGDLSDWDDRSSSWLLMTWDILAFYSRRYMQLVEGGEHMSYDTRRDCKVGFRSAWDNEALYFAVVANDESVPDGGKESDHVVIQLGDEPTLEVRAGPHVGGGTSAWKRTPTGYQLEIRIPYPEDEQLLNRIVPLDFYVHDVDKDEEYKGEEKYRWGKTILRWAGWSRDGGQLIFTDTYAAPKMPELGN